MESLTPTEPSANGGGSSGGGLAAAASSLRTSPPAIARLIVAGFGLAEE